MTLLETEAYETLLMVQDSFGPGRKHTKRTYTQVMGTIRETLRHFENARYGCPTGHHVSFCDCKPAVLGKAIKYSENRIHGKCE